MDSYERGTTHEIALLTLPDLGGESLERYSLEVARAWGIGKAESNGALLLIAKDDRKMRIEVGRGLEGNLTDSVSGRIIRDVIAPEFKRGRFHDGIRSGIEAMHAAIGGDYGPIRRSRGGQSSGGSIAGCLPAVFNLLFVVFLFSALARRRGGRGGRGGGGILPWLILANMSHGRSGGGGWGGGGGGGFSGFGGGGGFSGGGASGGW